MSNGYMETPSIFSILSAIFSILSKFRRFQNLNSSPLSTLSSSNENLLHFNTTGRRHTARDLPGRNHQTIPQPLPRPLPPLSLRDDPCLAAIPPIRRVDLTAAGILKAHGHWPHPSPLLGPVPGVEIGDQFMYRTELTLTRLHRPPENGIDYDAVSCLATSIVASGGYPDNYSLTNGTLIYTGMGGISRQRKGEPRDQKMEGGNLALKRSMEARVPVRVIYGIRDLKMKIASTFFYDGLYMVEEWRTVVGSNDCFVFEFRLRRIEAQPHCLKLETLIEKMARRSMNRHRRYDTGQRKLLNAKEKSSRKVELTDRRTLAKKSSAPQPRIRSCSRASYFSEWKEKGDDCASSSREGGGGRQRGSVSLRGGRQ